MQSAPDFIGLLSDPDVLQLLLFACPDGVVATDSKNRIVLYTGASEQIFGFAPFEVLHRDASMLFSSARDYRHIRALLRRDGRVVNVEMRATRKDADPFEAALSAAVLRDRCGAYTGTAAYIRDHSAMRHIEDALREKNDKLGALVTELDYVARHDQLTGLLYRGSAIAAAEAALLDSGLGGGSFGIVIFDLDYFKLVNDSYGHLVGDEVLASLARVLQATARDRDIIGRFGGEEFIAFLPGAGLEQSFAFAERVRVAIGEATVALGSEARIAVTVSAGVAAIPACADSLQEAIRVADDRLFIAKRRRNQCVADDAGQREGRSAA